MFKADTLLCLDVLTSHLRMIVDCIELCFSIRGGQGLSIKDTVPISDYEGAGFLKLAHV